MHYKYFKDQIYFELTDAGKYLKKAVDIYNVNPEWSKKFKQISESRQRTATELYQMFIKYCSESKRHDAYVTSIRDAIMSSFSDNMRKLEDYETVYNIMLCQENNKEVLTHERGFTN